MSPADFPIGTRVRHSDEWIAQRRGEKRRVEASCKRGVVTAHGTDGTVRVRWDGRKTVDAFHPDFLMLDAVTVQ